jgi:chromosome segregation ATPase
MPDILIQAVVPGIVSLIVVGGGYWANRKLGISSGQKTLVETLQGEIVAYEGKVNRLEVEFVACKSRLEDVEAVNADLKSEVFELRTQLQTMVLKVNRPRTRRTRTDD